MGRRGVTVFFTSLTGLLIAYGAHAIHRDTYAIPPGGTPDPNCSTGIHRLHDAFAAVWHARRSGRAVTVPPTLERDLLALRPMCTAEGTAAIAAYESMLRWRYRADGQSQICSALLSTDSERALGYHSPGAAMASPLGSPR